jgi:type II secretory pathway component PulF
MTGKSIPAPREADLIWLCRRLASALHGDASILSALDSAAEDAPASLAAPLRVVRQSVRAGHHIYVGFAQLDWPPFVVGMVHNGDIRNAVEAAFTLIADQLEAEQATPAAKDPDLQAYAVSLARLGVMVEAGVPILTALEAAAATDPRSQSHDVLLAARDPVRCGANLAETLASLAPDLPEMTIDMIRDAERDGRLGKALPVVADYLLDAAGQAKPRRKKQEV